MNRRWAGGDEDSSKCLTCGETGDVVKVEKSGSLHYVASNGAFYFKRRCRGEMASQRVVDLAVSSDPKLPRSARYESPRCISQLKGDKG